VAQARIITALIDGALALVVGEAAPRGAGGREELGALASDGGTLAHRPVVAADVLAAPHRLGQAAEVFAVGVDAVDVLAGRRRAVVVEGAGGDADPARVGEAARARETARARVHEASGAGEAAWSVRVDAALESTVLTVEAALLTKGADALVVDATLEAAWLPEAAGVLGKASLVRDATDSSRGEGHLSKVVAVVARSVAVG